MLLRIAKFGAHEVLFGKIAAMRAEKCQFLRQKDVKDIFYSYCY